LDEQLYEWFDGLEQCGMRKFEFGHATDHGVTETVIDVKLTGRARGKEGVVKI